MLNEIIKENYKDFSEFLGEIDFGTFSHSTTLQEYQQSALKHGLIALKLYMGDINQNHRDCAQSKRLMTMQNHYYLLIAHIKGKIS